MVRNPSDDSYINKILKTTELNQPVESENIKLRITADENEFSNVNVTYGMFLTNPRCLITLIGCSMVNILIDFLNSILSV